jgi:hypothetical protein
MPRILLVETASPGRVRKKAEEMRAGGIYESSELTILCRDDPQSIRELGLIEGARLIPLAKKRRSEILREMRRNEYDIVCAFWTGEKRYRGLKLRALRIPARLRQIDIGDGHAFRLTLGNFVRFLAIRWKHPLPSDHHEFAWRPTRPSQESHDPLRQVVEAEPAPSFGDKVLIIQSAEPPAVLRALERLKEQPLFREPRYILFCRARPEILKSFNAHPALYRIIGHSETRGAFKHLLDLRQQRFDSVVVFFTGDPSYWKIKYLAFLLGARHKVIFNENNDCFFFSWGSWFSHISNRMAQDLEPHWVSRTRAVAAASIKMLLLPLRFTWLLLVWLRLRGSSLGRSD